MLNDFRKNRTQLAAKALLLADDPTGKRYTATQVVDALNDAMLDLALDVQLIKEKLSILLLENQHLYEIHPRVQVAGKRPFGYPIRSVYDITTNAALSPIATSMFDLSGISFSETGGPTGWRTDIFAHGEMAFSPTPSSQGDALPLLTGNIELTYVAYPTIMDDGADYPDTLPAQYHEAVAVGAAMLLLEGGGTEEDLMLSASMEQEFEQWKAKIAGDEMRSMTHYNSIRPM